MLGQRINNYEILSQIGEGGMGTVYLARHPYIDRKAAIKVLRPSLAKDATLVQRFFNEARAANAIRHPNIIDIIDVGLTAEGGTPYLMMEFLEGENLSVRIKRMGKIRVGDAVEFAYQTASALSAAHSKGIIHRDLKPENLYLVPDPSVPGREVVKVLDFGIAKLRGDLQGDSVKTQTGALMGTPPYMSPEQCRGISDQIDHRTDIYALGIIMYEMLCGAPPFVGEGFGEILVMHLTRAVEPPRARNPGIPEHLEAVILRALAKDANQRFGSMTELQAALATGPARTVSMNPGAALYMTPAAVDVVPTGVPAPTHESARAIAPADAPESILPRQTTTFSSSTREVADDAGFESVPVQSRRGLLYAAAVVVIVGGGAAFGLLRTPGGGGVSSNPASHTTAAGASAKPAPLPPPALPTNSALLAPAAAPRGTAADAGTAAVAPSHTPPAPGAKKRTAKSPPKIEETYKAEKL